MSLVEKRKDPRIDQNIPVKISTKEFDIVTESKNLSASGAYCVVDKPLELMTKLKIQLLLPLRKKNKTVVKKISCQGVVVRSQFQISKNNYNIAIFFSDILEKDKKVISEHVKKCLTKKTLNESA